MPEIVAVCRVEKLLPDSGVTGVTAIDKRPVAARVRARPLGLRADVQVDRKHHGGLSKALYAYSEEDAAYWAEQLGRPVPAGLFGENLRTSGLEVSGAEIGERWRIGDEVVVEVTCPRTPCAVFQRRMKEPHWVRRFTEANRTGAYLRVVKSGTLGAGDGVEVVHRPGHGVTIASWFGGADEAQAQALEAAQAQGALALAPEMVESIRRLRLSAGRAS
ncbi:MOSC domain-containing protein [Leifsonia sp. AG29]|uniref:MOSC domain-containing protein n=1 Tax=Leifsonia sp. AG29 TaxID=2598860 RepID=UPI00131B99D0|nr:MOSC domain-containing protein [Leifsonia sp. AG29]